jgi:hypothetical protein
MTAWTFPCPVVITVLSSSAQSKVMKTQILVHSFKVDFVRNRSPYLMNISGTGMNAIATNPRSDEPLPEVSIKFN